MSKQPSTPSKSYIAAAEFADDNRCVACHALNETSGQGYGKGKLYRRFKNWFYFPDEAETPGWFGYVSLPDRQQHRVLSLCMMAAIAEYQERRR